MMRCNTFFSRIGYTTTAAVIEKERCLVVYDPMISLSKFVHNFKCSCRRRRREFSVLLVSVNGKEEKESSSYLIHVHNLYKKINSGI